MSKNIHGNWFWEEKEWKWTIQRGGTKPPPMLITGLLEAREACLHHHNLPSFPNCTHNLQTLITASTIRPSFPVPKLRICIWAFQRHHDKLSYLPGKFWYLKVWDATQPTRKNSKNLQQKHMKVLLRPTTTYNTKSNKGPNWEIAQLLQTVDSYVKNMMVWPRQTLSL